METTFWAVLAMTTAAGLATGLGGVIAVLFRPGERLLALSMGFAAGVMLTVSLADLAPASVEFYRRVFSPLGAGGAAASLFCMGMLLAVLLGRCLPEEEALSRLSGSGKRGKALRGALVTGAALLLHNLPEGILTFFSGAADPQLGLRMTLAIALHNIPEGLAVASPLYYATRKRGRSALIAFGSGLAEPVGALLAWGFLHQWMSEAMLNGMVAVVAGVMVWVAAAQLLPSGFAFGRVRATAAGFGVGMLFMLVGIAALE